MEALLVGAGLASGLLNGSLGTGGPPVIVVLHAAETEQHAVRAGHAVDAGVERGPPEAERGPVRHRRGGEHPLDAGRIPACQANKIESTIQESAAKDD